MRVWAKLCASDKTYSFQRGGIVRGGLGEEIMKRLNIIWLKGNTGELVFTGVVGIGNHVRP